MKTRNILILCTAFLVSMPSADAQSFKDGLKSLGDKIGKQIVKTTQSVKNQTTTASSAASSVELESPTVTPVNLETVTVKFNR